MQSRGRKGLSVAVDARSLCAPLAGIGHYVREVLLALDNTGSLRIHLYCAPRPPVIELPRHWNVRVARTPRQIALKLFFGHWADRDGADVFWAPQTLLPRTRLPTVATIHDLNHILVPDTMSWGTRLAHRLWFNHDVFSATRIVANSHATAQRLTNLVGRTTNAIATPGVAARFSRMDHSAYMPVLRKYGLEPHFLLAVGTLEPRKNIITLARAHAPLYAAGKAPPLALAGRVGWGEAFPASDFPGIRLLGYVADEDLPALYSAAAAFVLPSLYEGYGMPAAEARACGTRIMASNLPELREAAGPNAIFVAPDETGIRDGLLQVLALPPQPPARPSTWDGAACVYLNEFSAAAESLRSPSHTRL